MGIIDSRYRINGLIDTSNTALDNLEQLANACGSWMTYDTHEGKFAVVVNKFGISQNHFDDSNIIGSINVAFTPLDKMYNTVKVTFPHEDLKGQTDWVQISIPQIYRQANEYENVLVRDFSVVTNPVQAELLGFIELKQSRVDKVVTFKTDYLKSGIKAGDLFDITNDMYGWEGKVFRVISVTETDDSDGSIIISITGLEYSDGVYDEDLSRYQRTDSNGITPLASLSAPTKPIVTPHVGIANPYVHIETSLIDGLVTSIELWSSSDVTLSDAQRSYSLLKTVVSSGEPFALNTAIPTDVASLSASSFVVKARAVNSEGCSVFSLPSDTTVYSGTQVTDAISSATAVIDPNTNQYLVLLLPALLSMLSNWSSSGGTSRGGCVKVSQSPDLGVAISSDMNGVHSDGAKGTFTKINEFSYSCTQSGNYLLRAFARFGADATEPVTSNKCGFMAAFTGGYYSGYLGSSSTYLATTIGENIAPLAVDWEVNTDWNGDQYDDMWMERVMALQSGVTYYFNTFYTGTAEVTKVASKVVELIYTGV